MITAFCFLINNFSFAFDMQSPGGPQGNINLSPPLVLGGLDNTHHKKMSLAMMKLQMYLIGLDGLNNGIGGLEGVDSDEKMTEILKKLAHLKEQEEDGYIQEQEDTEFNPAEIKLYFNQIKHLGSFIFFYTCLSLKKGREGKLSLFLT